MEHWVYINIQTEVDIVGGIFRAGKYTNNDDYIIIINRLGLTAIFYYNRLN